MTKQSREREWRWLFLGYESYVHVWHIIKEIGSFLQQDSFSVFNRGTGLAVPNVWEAHASSNEGNGWFPLCKRARSL